MLQLGTIYVGGVTLVSAWLIAKFLYLQISVGHINAKVSFGCPLKPCQDQQAADDHVSRSQAANSMSVEPDPAAP